MRIAHIIDSMAWGGAQKLLVTFAETASQRNISLTIIVLNNNNGGAPFLADLEKMAIRVVTFHALRLFDLPRFYKLYRFLAQEQFDLVHTHLNYANILGTLAGWLTGTPTVTTLHNARVGINPIARKKIERRVLQKWTNQLVVVGQQAAIIQQSQFPGKTLHVVPNAVAPIPSLPESERVALRKELTGDAARPLLIAVGRLTAQKGVDDLLTALAQICQKHPRAALIIVGGGSIRADLNLQIKTLGLENNAWLLGGRSDVPRLLAASDLYVSASHTEGLPVAMLEAMSAGLPVVATGVGDVPVVLTRHSGIVVPPQEPDQLAQAVSYLLDNTEKLPMMGAAARKHAALHYSPEVWLDQLVAIYQEVLSRKPTATLMEA